MSSDRIATQGDVDRARQAGYNNGLDVGHANGARNQTLRFRPVIRSLVAHLRARTSQKEYLRQALAAVAPNHPFVNTDPITAADDPRLAEILAQYAIPDEVVRENLESLQKHEDWSLTKAAGGITTTKGDLALIRAGALSSALSPDEVKNESWLYSQYVADVFYKEYNNDFNTRLSSVLQPAYLPEGSAILAIFSLGMLEGVPDYRTLGLRDGLGRNKEERTTNLHTALEFLIKTEGGVVLLDKLLPLFPPAVMDKDNHQAFNPGQWKRNNATELGSLVNTHATEVAEKWLAEQREKYGSTAPDTVPVSAAIAEVKDGKTAWERFLG